MLVLSRREGEQLVIGPNIVVTVLEVRGNVVKLGCEAPMAIPISRQEVSQHQNRRRDGQSRAASGGASGVKARRPLP
jgi:carbon storage regulator